MKMFVQWINGAWFKILTNDFVLFGYRIDNQVLRILYVKHHITLTSMYLTTMILICTLSIVMSHSEAICET